MPLASVRHHFARVTATSVTATFVMALRSRHGITAIDVNDRLRLGLDGPSACCHRTVVCRLVWRCAAAGHCCDDDARPRLFRSTAGASITSQNHHLFKSGAVDSPALTSVDIWHGGGRVHDGFDRSNRDNRRIHRPPPLAFVVATTHFALGNANRKSRRRRSSGGGIRRSDRHVAVICAMRGTLAYHRSHQRSALAG